MDKSPPVPFSAPIIAALAVALAACASTLSAPNYRTLTKQSAVRGAVCSQAVARFADAPHGETRQAALGQLKELNAALIETAGYEREARRTNSVDLIDANRAFLETGRAWAACSLKYNAVLVAIGERDAARHNYAGLLARLDGPQFAAERRRIQAALEELDR